MPDPLEKSPPLNRISTLALCTALIVITAIAYVPALQAGFIWDDDSYVTQNPALRDGLAGLGRVWIPQSTPQYYPVVFTTFWIEWQLWEDDALGYHVVNIALHITNALLLCLVLIRCNVRPAIAWAIAFLFALHPVHVESVAWITERKNVLSLLFALLAALSYLRFDKEQSPGPPGVLEQDRQKRDTPWAWYAASIVLFVCALLSKTVTASLPIALAILLILKRGRISLKHIAPLVPMLVLGMAAGLHTGWIERMHVGALGPDWDVSLIDRTLIASKSFLFYPWKIIVPDPLIFIYPRWETHAANLLSWWPLVVCLLAAASLVLVWRRWKIVAPLLAALFYAAAIFPALGFANVYPHRFSFVADHFQYHASIGLLALAVMVIAALVRNQKALIAILVVLSAGCGWLTFHQTLIYENEQTLYEATVADNPAAWMAYTNLSRIHLLRAQAAMNAGEKNLMEAEARAAEQAARNAIKQRPNHERALTNLAEALRLQGQYEQSRMLIQKGIDTLTAELDWHERRGYESKFEFYEANLAIDEALLGRVNELLEQPDAAIAAYERVIALNADDNSTFLSHDGIARIARAQDRLDDAADHYERALEIDPSHFDAHLFLAEHARRSGEYQSAYAHLVALGNLIANVEQEQAVLYRVAWILATAKDDSVRDGATALQNASRLIELTNRASPDAFDALAAALAEVGRFDDAVKMADEAIKLTEAHGLKEQTAAIRLRRDLYASEQPYRE